MAEFAEIAPDGTVVRVVVVASDQAHRGQEFLSSDLGLGGVWVETVPDGGSRKNPAAVGGAYDTARDAFIPRKPYPSWSLDEDRCIWMPPIPYPAAEGDWVWDEGRPGWRRLKP